MSLTAAAAAASSFPADADGFVFRDRNGYIDWRHLHGIDVDRVVRTTDISTVESVLEQIVSGDISSERNLSQNNCVQLFRLCQLALGYLWHLQHVQSHLFGIWLTATHAATRMKTCMSQFLSEADGLIQHAHSYHHVPPELLGRVQHLLDEVLPAEDQTYNTVLDTLEEMEQRSSAFQFSHSKKEINWQRVFSVSADDLVGTRSVDLLKPVMPDLLHGSLLMEDLGNLNTKHSCHIISLIQCAVDYAWYLANTTGIQLEQQMQELHAVSSALPCLTTAVQQTMAQELPDLLATCFNQAIPVAAVPEVIQAAADTVKWEQSTSEIPAMKAKLESTVERMREAMQENEQLAQELRAAVSQLNRTGETSSSQQTTRTSSPLKILVDEEAVRLQERRQVCAKLRRSVDELLASASPQSAADAESLSGWVKNSRSAPAASLQGYRTSPAHLSQGSYSTAFQQAAPTAPWTAHTSASTRYPSAVVTTANSSMGGTQATPVVVGKGPRGGVPAETGALKHTPAGFAMTHPGQQMSNAGQKVTDDGQQRDLGEAEDSGRGRTWKIGAQPSGQWRPVRWFGGSPTSSAEFGRYSRSAGMGPLRQGLDHMYGGAAC